MGKKLRRYTEEDLARAFGRSSTPPVGAKGTQSNPYTREEFEALLEAGTWGGGYVGDEYIPAEQVFDPVIVRPSPPPSGSGSSSDGWYCPTCGHPYPPDAGSDYTRCSNCGSSVKPPSGPRPGSGSGGGGDTGGENTNPAGGYIANVIPKEAFSPYQHDNECLERCKEMLEYAGVETDVKEASIIMTQTTSDGRAGAATSSAQAGINLLNQTLESGKPIVVSIDHSKGAAGPNLAGGDHFVVVVGRGTSADGKVQYRYYDPATEHRDKGTSPDNVFTLGDDGRLTGYHNQNKEKPSVVVTVRPNKT